MARRGALAGRRQHSEKTTEWRPQTTPNTRKGGFDCSRRFAVLLSFFMAWFVFLIFIMAQAKGQHGTSLSAGKWLVND
jgi:hypothetical protein